MRFPSTIIAFLGFFFLCMSPGSVSPLPCSMPATRVDSLLYLKGRVLDSVARSPVAFTHIINTSRNTATICDTLGYFYLRVRINDSLRFTAIGYAPTVIVAGDSLLSLERLPDFFLGPVTYPIRGVSINPLGSYESFKGKVARLELPPSRYEIHPSILMEIEQGIDTLDMIAYPAMSPITALYNWLSKEGRSRRKLSGLIRQERFEEEIAYKYSPLIVSGITGYTGFELYRFMDFCSFSRKFLMEADLYQIQAVVQEKQKIFEALEEDK